MQTTLLYVVMIVSVLLQLTAVFLAIRLIRLSGTVLAWTLLAGGFAVQALRRVVSLIQVMSGHAQADLLVESLGLFISLLMVLGIWKFKPLFLEIAKSHRQLENINQSLEQQLSDGLYELQLKDQYIVLQSRQAAIGEMINCIAHQWKQPLNNLGLIIQQNHIDYSDGGMTNETMAAQTKKCLELISFMASTIDDFVNFYREDKLKTNFDIRQNVIHAVKLMSANLKDNKINVIVEPGEALYVDGYPNEYAQVVMNIIGNARDILVERSICLPVITVTLCMEEGKSVVLIRDNGGGIDTLALPKIFDQYFTTKQMNQGTGIGLYIARAIIENHMGGRLSAQNVPDGAEFRIEV
ncbi:MAG: HAMP domain-containing sensor histidine kinase [Desulfuromonadaceae bacterium]|nr:HAMP domain-containing sensor histidine kinase [Desulfuromonadaceae bacterium]MDD5104483.1 HAMP domain-containing sensor histidine kinase [Desulfuromonadaceae bacterium]